MHNGDAPESDQHSSGYTSPKRAPRGFKETWLVPFLIPVTAAGAVFLIILSVSQILLAVPASVSTMVALFIALLILLTCAYLSSVPQLKRQTVFGAIGVPVLVLAGSGIIARIYRQNNPTHEGAAGATSAASVQGGNQTSTPANEVTTDNKFSVTNYTVEAGKAVTIDIRNNGQAVHNFDILNVKDPSGNAVKTDLLQPGQDAKLTFIIGTEGTYNFQCDVHPTEMKGTITVTPANTSASAATQAAGPGAAGGLSEVTTDNKFSQTTFTINHGDQVALTVQNKGAALHNFHVMGGAKNKDGNDVKTPDLVQAGQSVTINFEIDQPGSYPFQCDVHPTEMKGTLVVK
jgi:plastocyanin